jgi:type IV pilus assembly protein PilB
MSATHDTSLIDTASASEVEALLRAQVQRVRGTGITRLGDRLVERGLISAAQLAEGLQLQRERGLRIGEMLVEMDMISSAQLSEVLAEHLGVPFVNLVISPPDPLLATLVPEGFARRYRAVAVERSSAGILVAMADPKDVLALDDLRVLAGQEIFAALADPEQLSVAIDRVYQASAIESTIDDAAGDVEPEVDLTADDITVNDGPMVRLVNAMFDQAIADRASDIHIEPGAKSVRIRTRVDGVLHDTSEAPLSMLRSLIVRLKVLGGLDIAQSRAPQDGRFTITSQGRSIDVRVATLPTAAGESAILRILDSDHSTVAFDNLGLTQAERQRLEPHLFARQGAIIVTGPTGAGKTTTLYAMLREINSRQKSIVSIEDPVEYVVDGIKQVQVNNRANMGFAPALRSVLRSDPDVILVGEVRDAETAKIAASASITGHLVLSSLHTTSAAATTMRLADMGVEPYMVASALTCVVSQRLARRLCQHCAQPLNDPDLSVLRELGAPEEILEGATIRTPVGCPACRGTGYHGRMSIFEIMPLSDEIRRLIVERASVADIERVAVEQGMDTLWVAALRRVASGELSIDEMLRIAS